MHAIYRVPQNLANKCPIWRPGSKFDTNDTKMFQNRVDYKRAPWELFPGYCWEPLWTIVVCVCLCFPMCVCVCVPVCIVHAIYRAPQVLAKILSNLEAWIQIRYKSVLTQSRLQEGPLGVFSRILLGAISDNCCVRMFVFPCVCIPVCLTFCFCNRGSC